MAEMGLVPSQVTELAEVKRTLREYTSDGRTIEYLVPFPTTANFREMSFAQQVYLLKIGTMQKYSLDTIVQVLERAERYDLDALQGDVYPTGEGRIAISNKAKIRLAEQTGRIEGMEWEFERTSDPISLSGCPLKQDIICHATIHIKGWKVPLRNSQRLSEWYVASNPNWKGRPEHMLKLNTTAHACEFINPTETGDDEFPVAQVTPVRELDLEARLKASIEAVKNRGEVIEGEVIG